MFSGTAQVSHQVCQFFCQFCMSSGACDNGGYTQGRRLLFASYIGHNVIRKEKSKRKMWIKKWYLKAECLEMMT
jgi:hypothetical protein